MEADAKANESAAASSSATATTAGEGGGGAGGTAPATESEFYNTGRVGRRNALPDILNHHHSTTSTADLPDKLSALSTSGKESIKTKVFKEYLNLLAHFCLADGGGPSDGSGSGPPKQ